MNNIHKIGRRKTAVARVYLTPGTGTIVMGGEITGQAEAIRLAISRALCEMNPENRPALKKEGLLTRNPKMVERKKSGQKKARKKFQFSKR